jgi:hypothetical protein
LAAAIVFWTDARLPASDSSLPPFFWMDAAVRL